MIELKKLTLVNVHLIKISGIYNGEGLKKDSAPNISSKVNFIVGNTEYNSTKKLTSFISILEMKLFINDSENPFYEAALQTNFDFKGTAKTLDKELSQPENAALLTSLSYPYLRDITKPIIDNLFIGSANIPWMININSLKLQGKTE